MSICFDAVRSSNDEIINRYIYDDPEQCVNVDIRSKRYFLEVGFDYHAPGTVTLNALSYMTWYRFTDRGMLLGYFVNPGGTSIQVPTTVSFYYTIRLFNFNTFQLKFYIQCMDHELFTKNRLSYFYDYTLSDEDETFSRIINLDKLNTIQVKGFHNLSTASFLLFPYTFFNTYKFDFEHTMYNTDGTLKDGSTYHPVMFADGGQLNPKFNFHD